MRPRCRRPHTTPAGRYADGFALRSFGRTVGGDEHLLPHVEASWMEEDDAALLGPPLDHKARLFSLLVACAARLTVPWTAPHSGHRLLRKAPVLKLFPDEETEADDGGGSRRNWRVRQGQIHRGLGTPQTAHQPENPGCRQAECTSAAIRVKPMHIWSARDPARQTNNARFDSSRHNL